VSPRFESPMQTLGATAATVVDFRAIFGNNSTRRKRIRTPVVEIMFKLKSRSQKSELRATPSSGERSGI
jgi:hypothetical protein